MFVHRHVAALLSVAAMTTVPVKACRVSMPTTLADVRYADVVLIGRIKRYTIVRDRAFRRKMLSNAKLSQQNREFYQGDHLIMGDYARFAVQVDEVLTGRPPVKTMVTWQNSTFGIPKTLPAGRLLMALRKPTSKAPPLRGPSGTISPNPEPQPLTILQAACSGAFIFAADSREALTIRQMLASRQ